VIAVDTNILARFYCDDADDPEAARQRPRARKVMTESPAVFVPLTAVLELEWVMRGFYELPPAATCDALEHLIGMQHVTVERWEAIKDAVDLHRKGFDFADALHWACSRSCTRLATFDEKTFARRARKLGLQPEVFIPAA
jgi:predicted nucleic-acid-binding protein